MFNKEKILFYNSLANEITLNTVKSVQTFEAIYKADAMLITFGVLSLSDQTFLPSPFLFAQLTVYCSGLPSMWVPLIWGINPLLFYEKVLVRFVESESVGRRRVCLIECLMGTPWVLECVSRRVLEGSQVCQKYLFWDTECLCVSKVPFCHTTYFTWYFTWNLETLDLFCCSCNSFHRGTVQLRHGLWHWSLGKQSQSW